MVTECHRQGLGGCQEAQGAETGGQSHQKSQNFDNEATSKIDDVLTEHHPPNFFLLDLILNLSYFLSFLWDPSFMLKSYRVVGWWPMRF